MIKRLVGLMVLPMFVLVAAKPAPRPTPHSEPKRSTPPKTPAVSPEVVKAQAELEEVAKRLRGEFEKGDDYLKADGALKEAQQAQLAAMKNAALKIKDTPEYAAALETQKKVEDEQLNARLNPAAQVAPDLAGRVMDARTAVYKLETDAFDADPASKETKQKVLAAKEVLNGLRGKFEESLRANPDWTAAKKALDNARSAAKGK